MVLLEGYIINSCALHTCNALAPVHSKTSNRIKGTQYCWYVHSILSEDPEQCHKFFKMNTVSVFLLQLFARLAPITPIQGFRKARRASSRALSVVPRLNNGFESFRSSIFLFLVPKGQKLFVRNSLISRNVGFVNDGVDSLDGKLHTKDFPQVARRYVWGVVAVKPIKCLGQTLFVDRSMCLDGGGEEFSVTY